MELTIWFEDETYCLYKLDVFGNVVKQITTYGISEWAKEHGEPVRFILNFGVNRDGT